MTYAVGQQIGAALITIREAWPHMLPKGARTGSGGRVGGTQEPPPPAPLAVLSVRRETCEALVDWCRLVLDEHRDINGRPDLTAHLLGTDAPGMTRWLATWVDWLAHHPAGADAATELSRWARTCDDIARQRRTRRFPVGPCPENILDTDRIVTCPGTLHATIRSDDDLLPHALTCDHDPRHTWTAAQWRRLGERIHATLTVEEATRRFIADLLGA